MTSAYILLGIGIALVAGLISNRLIKLVHLPNVTAYLIVGILLGPYLFSLFNSKLDGVINKEMVSAFGIIVDLALGFIAFSIGSEFKLSSIKKIGKGVITITIMQSCMALVAVDVFLIITCLIVGNLEANLPLILTLGAIATATAPAATLMVVKQYKARGPVTDILLPVVAFDDAIGLILFSISFSVAQVLARQYAGVAGATISIKNILLMPLCEIFLSLAIGAVLGFILTLAMKFFKSRANRLICMLAAVILGVGFCELFAEKFNMELSSLLTCMMIGAIFCNMEKDAINILDGVERWTPALFMLFFILSGAELDFSVMGSWTVIGICAVYLLARSVGKYFGASLGCTMTHKGGTIKKYLGLTLLPQAGVAIGMARSSSSTFRSFATAGLKAVNESGYNYLTNMASTITAVVLCATLFYELVGPVITKIALTKAGEIQTVNK
ncbi:MAG: cation:proton antiporter [Bacilli bacterium]|nr:cation:proton antiporter [Mollicutes bacterium]MDY3898909.1 cation:proton antiporter [Bacilli bacterium]